MSRFFARWPDAQTLALPARLDSARLLEGRYRAQGNGEQVAVSMSQHDFRGKADIGVQRQIASEVRTECPRFGATDLDVSPSGAVPRLAARRFSEAIYRE